LSGSYVFDSFRGSRTSDPDVRASDGADVRASDGASVRASDAASVRSPNAQGVVPNDGDEFRSGECRSGEFRSFEFRSGEFSVAASHDQEGSNPSNRQPTITSVDEEKGPEHRGSDGPMGPEAAGGGCCPRRGKVAPG
jgi:hypothetical protein